MSAPGFPLFSYDGDLLFCAGGKLAADCCSCNCKWAASVLSATRKNGAWCQHTAWFDGPVVICTAGDTPVDAALAATKALDYIHDRNEHCCDPGNPGDCDDYCAGDDMWQFTAATGSTPEDSPNPSYCDVTFDFSDCHLPGITPGIRGTLTLRMTLL